MVRLGALGDVVRTLPAASSLRAGYPGAHIAWLVEPAAAGAVEGQPWVDEVLLFPRPALEASLRELRLGRATRELVRFARALRRRRFELVVDFHSILRSALLARLSGAPCRVGYAPPFGRELSYAFATLRARIGPERTSRFARNAALVHFLGVDAAPAKEPMRVDPALRARMEAALAPGPRPVALHPGSSDAAPEKRWHPRGWADVARSLYAAGLPCIVTCGPGRGDRLAADAVVAAAGGAARRAPATPRVADLAALLANCRLTVAGDTGPLHVSSLVGTPVVQILCGTDAVENAPWAETAARVVRAAAGPEPDPEPVLQGVAELLARLPAGPLLRASDPAAAPAPASAPPRIE